MLLKRILTQKLISSLLNLFTYIDYTGSETCKPKIDHTTTLSSTSVNKTPYAVAADWLSHSVHKLVFSADFEPLLWRLRGGGSGNLDRGLSIWSSYTIKFVKSCLASLRAHVPTIIATHTFRQVV